MAQGVSRTYHAAGTPRSGRGMVAAFRKPHKTKAGRDQARGSGTAAAVQKETQVPGQFPLSRSQAVRDRAGEQPDPSSEAGMDSLPQQPEDGGPSFERNRIPPRNEVVCLDPDRAR